MRPPKSSQRRRTRRVYLSDHEERVLNAWAGRQGFKGWREMLHGNARMLEKVAPVEAAKGGHRGCPED